MVLGTISPGRDRSGRNFPFLMFCNIRKTEDLPFHLIPGAYNEIFTAFSRIIKENTNTEDITGLKSLTDNVKLSFINTPIILDNYKKFLSDNVLSYIFDPDKDDQFQLNIFFSQNLKILDHVICFNSPVDSFQPDNSFLISFYIQLFQKIFRNSSNPGIFWIKNDKSIFLFMSFTKPTPKDFSDLIINAGKPGVTEDKSI
ncbi:MAG: DUF2094 domain-containing protein, partial [Ignavibacteriales bacterium]